MSDSHKEDKSHTPLSPKALTPQQIMLEKSRQSTQNRAQHERSNSAALHARRPAHNSVAYKHQARGGGGA